MVPSQRIKTKRREEPTHEIRKQLGKNERDGKSLLSLSIQSYAGHRHQTKATIFSGEREGGDKSGVKPGSSPLGSSPGTSWSMGQLKKVFQESVLMSGLQRAALSTGRSTGKNLFYFLHHRTSSERF